MSPRPFHLFFVGALIALLASATACSSNKSKDDQRGSHQRPTDGGSADSDVADDTGDGHDGSDGEGSSGSDGEGSSDGSEEGSSEDGGSSGVEEFDLARHNHGGAEAPFDERLLGVWRADCVYRYDESGGDVGNMVEVIFDVHNDTIRQRTMVFEFYDEPTADQPGCTRPKYASRLNSSVTVRQPTAHLQNAIAIDYKLHWIKIAATGPGGRTTLNGRGGFCGRTYDMVDGRGKWKKVNVNEEEDEPRDCRDDRNERVEMPSYGTIFKDVYLVGGDTLQVGLDHNGHEDFDLGERPQELNPRIVLKKADASRECEYIYHDDLCP